MKKKVFLFVIFCNKFNFDKIAKYSSPGGPNNKILQNYQNVLQRSWQYQQVQKVFRKFKASWNKFQNIITRPSKCLLNN